MFNVLYKLVGTRKQAVAIYVYVMCNIEEVIECPLFIVLIIDTIRKIVSLIFFE